MKRCPTCSTTFDDEELSFCTNDGTPLPPAERSADAQSARMFADPPATMVMPPPRPTEYAPPPAPMQPSTPQPYGWSGGAQPFVPPPAPVAVMGPAFGSGPQQSLAVASLVLGLVSITVGWCCYFGTLTGPLAIALGIFSLVQIKNNPAQYAGRGFAIGGIVTGGLYLVFTVLLVLLYGAAILLGGLK